MLLWQWLDPFLTLRTPGFVNDVMYSHHGENGPKLFCRVRQMAAPGAKLLSRIVGLFVVILFVDIRSFVRRDKKHIQ